MYYKCPGNKGFTIPRISSRKGKNEVHFSWKWVCSLLTFLLDFGRMQERDRRQCLQILQMSQIHNPECPLPQTSRPLLLFLLILFLHHVFIPLLHLPHLLFLLFLLPAAQPPCNAPARLRLRCWPNQILCCQLLWRPCCPLWLRSHLRRGQIGPGARCSHQRPQSPLSLLLPRLQHPRDTALMLVSDLIGVHPGELAQHCRDVLVPLTGNLDEEGRDARQGSIGPVFRVRVRLDSNEVVGMELDRRGVVIQHNHLVGVAVQAVEVLDVHTLHVVRGLTIQPVHDKSVGVEGFHDQLGNALVGGAVEHDLVVLGHVVQEFVDSGALGVAPAVLAVPSGAYQGVLKVEDEGVWDGNIVGDLRDLGPIRYQLRPIRPGEFVRDAPDLRRQSDQLREFRRRTFVVVQSPRQQERRHPDAGAVHDAGGEGKSDGRRGGGGGRGGRPLGPRGRRDPPVLLGLHGPLGAEATIGSELRALRFRNVPPRRDFGPPNPRRRRRRGEPRRRGGGGGTGTDDSAEGRRGRRPGDCGRRDHGRFRGGDRSEGWRRAVGWPNGGRGGRRSVFPSLLRRAGDVGP
mmetsp:Transcript_17008/g.34914  ORF Transcript_17008/g.34914 Transcript_17008/m.34914 type:complete len:571 (+) Transcript_17008:35-1747(+)